MNPIYILEKEKYHVDISGYEIESWNWLIRRRDSIARSFLGLFPSWREMEGGGGRRFLETFPSSKKRDGRLLYFCSISATRAHCAEGMSDDIYTCVVWISIPELGFRDGNCAEDSLNRRGSDAWYYVDTNDFVSSRFSLGKHIRSLVLLPPFTASFFSVFPPSIREPLSRHVP